MTLHTKYLEPNFLLPKSAITPQVDKKKPKEVKKQAFCAYNANSKHNATPPKKKMGKTYTASFKPKELKTDGKFILQK